jgi:hypothetical protein
MSSFTFNVTPSELSPFLSFIPWFPINLNDT